jgi:hypothetical protein
VQILPFSGSTKQQERKETGEEGGVNCGNHKVMHVGQKNINLKIRELNVKVQLAISFSCCIRVSESPKSKQTYMH